MKRVGGLENAKPYFFQYPGNLEWFDEQLAAEEGRDGGWDDQQDDEDEEEDEDRSRGITCANSKL